jgi:hypothetical protein
MVTEPTLLAAGLVQAARAPNELDPNSGSGHGDTANADTVVLGEALGACGRWR